MYLGNQPALSYTSFAKQDFTTSATTSYTLDNPVANENEIALFINFVRQEPTTAYTASGTSLTLTSATSASDDMYCVFLGKAVQTVNPPNGSVGTSQLDSSLDFSSKTITLADNMKNTPAFMVGLSGNQGSITAASFAKVTFDSEDVDTDNAFASNKFTVPSGKAGKYFIGLDVQMNAESGAGTAQVGSVRIYKNGSAAINGGIVDFRNTNGQKFNANVSAIMDLSAGDYLEGYAELHTSSGDVTFVASNRSTKFFGYKLIGV